MTKIGFCRRIVQALSIGISNLGFAIGMTGLIYPFLFCYASPGACAACPIGILEHSIVPGRRVNACLLLYLVSTLALVGLVFGRGACGWACPVGTFQDLISKITKKRIQDPLEKRMKNAGAAKSCPGCATKQGAPGAAMKSAESNAGKSPLSRRILHPRNLKYLVLAASVGVLFLTSSVMFTDICPVGILVGTIPNAALNPGRFAPNDFFWIAIWIFAAFLALIVLMGRSWCRYLCPVGAAMAPFNKASFVHLKVDKSKCKDCGKCMKECPMKIGKDEIGRNTECILCGRCIDECKLGAIKYALEDGREG